MADRPMPSTSRPGKPRMRSRSSHLPTCIPIASKAVRPRAKSVQKTQVKGKRKGTGKGKGAKNKSGKAVVVISSDSEDSEVDFLHHPPNQPVNLPAEEPQEPNQPLDVPPEGPEEPEEPNQLLDIPAERPEEPQEPNNPNPLRENLPIPMANNQLYWSHFQPDFSGKHWKDIETHLLRTNDWMTTHDFQMTKRDFV